MSGPEAAAETLAAYLRAVFPLHLAAMRAAETLTPTDVPDPKLVSSADLPELGIEHWPALVVVPERLLDLAVADYAPDMRPRTEARYQMAVEGYVRAQGFEATGRLTRRYATALRSALLTSRTARPAGVAWGPESPRIDVRSIREEYSPTVEISRGRTIGSFRTVFDLTQAEMPYILPVGASGLIGTVETVEVETKLIPHPAL